MSDFRAMLAVVAGHHLNHLLALSEQDNPTPPNVVGNLALGGTSGEDTPGSSTTPRSSRAETSTQGDA